MKEKQQTKNTIKFFVQQAARYKLSFFIVALVISMASIVGHALYPLYFKEVIDATTLFTGTDKTDLNSELIRLVSMLGGLFIFEIICWRVAIYVNNHFQSSIKRNIPNDCYRYLHQHSISFFSNNFIGSLVTKTKRLADSFDRVTNMMFWDIIPTLIVFVFSITILYSIIPLFGHILLIWSVLFICISVRLSLWKMKFDLDAANKSSIQTGNYADGLTNFFPVKIFAQRKYEQKRFESSSETLKKANKKAWDYSNHIEIFHGSAMIVLEIGMLYLCIKFWQKDLITVGEIVLIESLLLSLTRKLWNLGNNVKEIITSLADANEMTEILNAPYEIKDPKDPETCRIQKGHIEIKDMTFSYEMKNLKNKEENSSISTLHPSPTNVFQDFNLDIKPGEKVGLVGESGSGKSTLTKILFRFNDINEGIVTIDGQDITKITQDTLREQIAFVPQEPILFHRSLEENIRYGNIHASDEEVIEAAKKAHAQGFITKTKEGYDTLVGERGIKLSGGEKQRIAIARAMLKKAPILILDEATSALDSIAETHIQEALEILMKDCTTIVIAHRLSTLRKMDRLIVLDQGKIVEQGSHRELVEQNGKYNELWSHQVGGFISE